MPNALSWFNMHINTVMLSMDPSRRALAVNFFDTMSTSRSMANCFLSIHNIVSWNAGLIWPCRIFTTVVAWSLDLPDIVDSFLVVHNFKQTLRRQQQEMIVTLWTSLPDKTSMTSVLRGFGATRNRGIELDLHYGPTSEESRCSSFNERQDPLTWPLTRPYSS